MEKAIIVGTGPAGLTAAVYLARADLRPLVIEGLQPGGQLTTTTEVENYPGFVEAVTGPELVERMKQQAARFGANFRDGDVTGCDFSGRPLELTLSGGETLEAEAVIIATGASALYLDIASVRRLIGRGVSACATCDGAFFRGVPVAVVGGGDSAMEEALFLAKFASRVTVIHRRDKLRASRIMADRVLKHERIDVRWNSVVDEVLGVEDNEVKGVRLKDVNSGDTSEIEVAGLFMAIGHKPNTDAFKGQVRMDEQGFITTEATRTGIDGVFAAGDVQDRVYRQAVTAAGSGCMAALEAERYLEALHA
jgi:thioredoxin reductase (NADPH)